MRRKLWIGVWRAWLGVACATGCAQLFGIEEACEIGVDEGCAADACEQYCDAMLASSCQAPPQYTNRDQCLLTCALFPPDGDDAGNDVACRLEVASRASLESADCQDAGPTGGDLCGGTCDTYCFMMEELCPGFFDLFDRSVEGRGPDQVACASLCETLTATGDAAYDAGPLGEEGGPMPSAQCRIWHLIVGAERDERSRDRWAHCGHAVGSLHCTPVAGDPPPEIFPPQPAG